MGHFARRQHNGIRNRITETLKSYHSLVRKGVSPGKGAAMRKQRSNGNTTFISVLGHWPERLHWMDPLSLFHRWGIFAGLALLIAGFLLPGETQQFPEEHAINPSSSTVMQAQLDNAQDDTLASPPPSSDDPQGQWHRYHIAAGQTLAQLFRDNNLPVGDVFAMADVEGQDKPLSNLQTGQEVRLRINDRGTVTGLTLTTKKGQVLFIRQQDGTFLQAR